MLRRNSGDDRSVPEIMQDIAGNVEDIARSEVLLAKIEIKEEVTRTAKASSSLVLGIIFGFYAFGFGLLAAVYALAMVLRVWLAALTVSIAMVVIALVFVAVGKSKLKAYLDSGKSVKSLLEKEKKKWSKTQSKSDGTFRNDAAVSTTTSAN